MGSRRPVAELHFWSRMWKWIFIPRSWQSILFLPLSLYSSSKNLRPPELLFTSLRQPILLERGPLLKARLLNKAEASLVPKLKTQCSGHRAANRAPRWGSLKFSGVRKFKDVSEFVLYRHLWPTCYNVTDGAWEEVERFELRMAWGSAGKSDEHLPIH